MEGEEKKEMWEGFFQWVQEKGFDEGGKGKMEEEEIDYYCSSGEEKEEEGEEKGVEMKDDELVAMRLKRKTTFLTVGVSHAFFPSLHPRRGGGEEDDSPPVSPVFGGRKKIENESEITFESISEDSSSLVSNSTLNSSPPSPSLGSSKSSPVQSQSEPLSEIPKSLFFLFFVFCFLFFVFCFCFCFFFCDSFPSESDI